MAQRRKRTTTRWTEPKETPIWLNPCLRPDHKGAIYCDGYCREKLEEERNVGDVVYLVPTLGCLSESYNGVFKKEWEDKPIEGIVIYKNSRYFTVHFGKFKESYNYIKKENLTK